MCLKAGAVRVEERNREKKSRIKILNEEIYSEPLVFWKEEMGLIKLGSRYN